MKILKASISELDQIVSLFDDYRQFYGQKSDIDAAREFLRNRFANNESVIFLAMTESNEALGFVQLYPSFSSVAMKPMWYLNDLFVSDGSRNQGVARALLQKVKCFAKETNALTVKLATSATNDKAKSLYESEGYDKVVAFEHYTQKVKQA
ncbi:MULTISPECIES: GNAT family N-acetyltransferase [Vibrio]|uniref:GNAT family N-acetyltransferase n=1 Tax=Vibrio TaxID=662 RepID=UPI0004D65010|nr:MULTISPECIES: GNAT family N-acetyltransferase [Vibrio]EGQ7876145.1 GNAT family N-acetyltransferase [Vibrio parahaemolyticus]EGR9059392.1 GNAT family N-acetyltransferase [Vibrio parahaemolyticus]EHW8638811.1 GNAT family N-acetyltransferase [Vibrio parahaemolyticus]EJU9077206.1 GNAT family N-acetyltransferase [Vibrio parahaemolyticus]EJU9190817.1 GNAT family N-acetyltransferase [Vibrio parahaemolyticus]